MHDTYDTLVTLLKNILEPPPANQQCVPDYCERMLQVLSTVKHLIEDLEESYRNAIEEFSGI